MDILNCDTTASFNLGLTNFIAEHCGCDALSESIAPEQIGEMVECIALLYYNMSDVDKIKVFLTGMGNQAGGRHGKSICRILARLTKRSERELQGLADEPKARLFVRHLAHFELQHPSMVMALAYPTYRRLADQVLRLPAQSLHERAWWLAGGLYSWGEDISKSDKPFPNAAIKNREIVRAIYSDPKLAAARGMIGEYLLRQLVLVEEQPLLFEVLPSDMVKKFPHLLTGLVVREGIALAREKDLDQVKSLVARFPLLKQEGILAIALRRSGQFEAAASELRNCQHELPGERELLQARIADAFVFSLPNNPDEQNRLRDQLEPLLETDYKADSEIGYCKCLAGLLVGDPVVAEQSYLWLRNLVKANCSGRAYRLLAAVQSRNPQYIQEALSAVESSEAAELFRSMPTNLLEAGIGALADYPDPSALRGLTDFIHTQAPELLDALTAREDWLLADPNVRQRWMAQLQAGDSVTKWKGYQQVIEVATQCGDSQLQVQAVEACLSLPDPSLAPQQAEMLQQRIYSCDDMGLREHLIERLVAIRPDQAQPHLWQLLQVYRGQQRQRDAARIVKLLKDIGEDGPTLRDCAKANGNHRSH